MQAGAIHSLNYPAESTLISSKTTIFHNVKPEEMTKVVDLALTYLLSSNTREDYISKKLSKLPCSLYIAPQDKKVFILFGKHATDYKKDGPQKEASCLEIYLRDLVSANQCIATTKYSNSIALDNFLTGKVFGQFSAVFVRSEKNLTTIRPIMYCSFFEIRARSTLSFYEVAKRLALAIKKFHDNNIVHNHITPENIFLTTSGEIYFKDLSLAYNPTLEKPKGLKPLAYGIAKYASLESLDKKRQLPLSLKEAKESDIFALGCTLYLFVTGKEVPWNIDMQNYWFHQAKVQKKIKTTIEATIRDSKDTIFNKTDLAIRKLMLTLFAQKNRATIDQFLHELETTADQIEKDKEKEKEGALPTLQLTKFCELFGLPGTCSVCQPTD